VGKVISRKHEFGGKREVVKDADDYVLTLVTVNIAPTLDSIPRVRNILG
jgi:hypothetical protein